MGRDYMRQLLNFTDTDPLDALTPDNPFCVPHANTSFIANEFMNGTGN